MFFTLGASGSDRLAPSCIEEPLMDPERVARLPLFADLDDGERAEIAARLREINVQAGTTVAAQGDNAYEFFVIEAGEAEVRKHDREAHAGDHESLRATMRDRVARTSL